MARMERQVRDDRPRARVVRVLEFFDARTYGTAMLVYQQSDRAFFFNQAHNHYLQLAAEGSLLLAVPTIVALVFLARLARHRLSRDHAGLYWIQAGAAAGLVAVAVQSLWETGLRMPENAALAAVLAAIVVHSPQPTLKGEDVSAPGV